jgi:hypothetical protein
VAVAHGVRLDVVRRSRPATVITDAAQSPAEELRQRQTRYIVMMLVRAGCLVLAAVLAMLNVPLLALWVVLCLIGAVLLPWLAVIWANNKRPRPEYRLANKFKPRPAPAPPAQPALSHRPEPTVIDADQ